MTPETALKQAKKKELLPVYLVTGEEAFLRDEVVLALRTAALDGAVAAFNEDKFTAGETDVDKVMGAVRTVPMMSAKRFVMVRGAERWDGGGEDSKAASPFDRLAEYVASPIKETCLVIVAAKIDGRRKFAAIAKKQDFVVNCNVMDDRSLPGWIADRAAAKGNVIDRDTAGLIGQLSGPELGNVNDSIERLSLYVGPGAPITDAAVRECIARVRLTDTWALVDAVGQRDLAKALRTLADAYDPRDRGIMLLGALAWSIRQFAKFQAGLAAGASVDEAAKAAGVFQPNRARDLAAKAKAVSAKEVEKWIVILAETDVALKSSRLPPDSILEDMVIRLCKKGR